MSETGAPALPNGLPNGRKSKPFGPFERTLAWRYLRARREHGGAALVSIISFVGIALAVTALVVVMSLMNGFRGAIVDSMLSGRGHGFVLVNNIPAEESDRIADIIRQINGVNSVTPIVEGQAFAQSEAAARGVFIRGLPGDAARELDFIKDPKRFTGSAETFGKGERGGDEILLAAKICDTLRVYPGENIKLISSETTSTISGRLPKSKAYKLAGCFRTGFQDLDEILALMPLEQAQIFFNSKGVYQTLELRIAEPAHPEAIMSQIGQRFPGLQTIDWKQQNAGLVSALGIESAMMRIIFLILVTITSLNIITGVVMLVKNKTRDVAILRTIGASRGSVLRVFLMVGAFLGVVGTLVGLTLGLLMVWQIGAVESFLNFVAGTRVFNPDVYGLDHLPAKINWFEVGGATVWAIGMSVLVTLAPAWRAARLDPVEALRFE